MGIQDLWSYVLAKCPDACKTTDLSSIARKVIEDIKRNSGVGNGTAKNPARLNLVIDASDCLDRLYGGFYNDWICGGGWNRMTTFLQELHAGLQKSHIHLVPMFNGAMELAHIHDWHQRQLEVKARLANVFQYLSSATVGQWKPPPKIWWVAPGGLEMAMRMAFRRLSVASVCTTEDHSQEVIDYCREHNLHGLLAESAVYMIFQPPRLFSAISMKLKFTGKIDITEFDVDAIARSLDLHPNRFTLLAALLGNHLLPAKDLHEFYCFLLETDPSNNLSTVEPEAIIELVLGFVRRLDSIDADSVGNIIFRNSPTAVKGECIGKLNESIQYYVNGTKEGYEKFKPKLKGEKHDESESKSEGDKNKVEPLSLISSSSSTSSSLSSNGPSSAAVGGPTRTSSGKGLRPGGSNQRPQVSTSGTPPESAPFFSRHQVSAQLMREASERQQKGTMHPWIYQVLAEGAIKVPIGLENEAAYDLPLSVDLFRPIRQSVYGVLFDTHKRMLKTEEAGVEGGESTPEDTSTTSTVTGAANSSGVPEKSVVINEWVVRKTNLQCESVKASGFDWQTPVPPCEQLWYGKTNEDRNRRMRAFLTCMDNELAPLLLDTNYVPPKHVILCCVLRFMLTQRVIREFELRAFLAQAVNPMLHNVDAIMKMELPYINPRAVQLSALFMKGVEHAIFANDACGAPIPWDFTCPWQYFDGKLFQYTYQMFECNEPLPKACGFQSVNAMISLQEAVMAGLTSSTGMRRVPPMPRGAQLPAFFMGDHTGFPNDYLDLAYGGGGGGMRGAAVSHQHAGPFPASQYVSGIGRGDSPQGGGGGGGGGKKPVPGGGVGPSSVDYRGGKLEVGGIVVSNWGANVAAASGGRGRGNRDRGGHNNAAFGPGFHHAIGPFPGPYMHPGMGFGGHFGPNGNRPMPGRGGFNNRGAMDDGWTGPGNGPWQPMMGRGSGGRGMPQLPPQFRRSAGGMMNYHRGGGGGGMRGGEHMAMGGWHGGVGYPSRGGKMGGYQPQYFNNKKKTSYDKDGKKHSDGHALKDCTTNAQVVEE